MSGRRPTLTNQRPIEDDGPMRIHKHLTYSNVLATIAVLAVLGGGSYAFAASDSNTLRACAKKRGGALRIASRCKRGERRISWNKVGPRGSRGPAGTPGTPGTPAVVGVTTLPTWGGDLTDAHGDLTWRLHRTLGTFTKASATTHTIVTVAGTIDSGAYSCLVQVRVDAKAADGTTPTGLSGSANPGTTGTRGPGAALQAPHLALVGCTDLMAFHCVSSFLWSQCAGPVRPGRGQTLAILCILRATLQPGCAVYHTDMQQLYPARIDHLDPASVYASLDWTPRAAGAMNCAPTAGPASSPRVSCSLPDRPA